MTDAERLALLDVRRVVDRARGILYALGGSHVIQDWSYRRQSLHRDLGADLAEIDARLAAMIQADKEGSHDHLG